MPNRQPIDVDSPHLFSVEPYEIRLGVTGHRRLQDPEAVRRSVEKVLADLDSLLETIPHRYIVMSPLADGADRLVATCVLAWKGKTGHPINRSPELEAILPMAPSDYMETFNPESRADSEHEFNALLARAERVHILPQDLSHKAAYKQVGRTIVEGCDILIAIWDGEPARGEGGTAEIVKFAEESERSTFRINPVSGTTTLWTTPRGFVNQINLLSEYEAEQMDGGGRLLAAEVNRRLQDLQRDWQQVGLDPAVLEPLRSSVLPYFVKATTMAAKYQDRYFRSVICAYWLSAAAVFCAAAGALVFPGRDGLFVLEFGLIFLAIVMVWPSRFERWQRKWVDYRYLAERLRSSYFLYLAELAQDISEAPPDLELSSLPESWTDVALRDAWKNVPPFKISSGLTNDHAEMQSKVSAFLRLAWIDKQVIYYDRAAHRNLRSTERSEILLKSIAFLTLLAALLHILLPRILPAFDQEGAQLPRMLSLLAVTLPAVASVLAGISVFRNSSRNAERYANMSRHLQRIGRRMSDESTPADVMPQERPALTRFQQLVREADLVMTHEHRSWRAVFGIRLPGPG